MENEMFKWYANYCNSNLWFFKIGNIIFNDTMQWKGVREEDESKPDLIPENRGHEVWAYVLGSGAISAWASNVGEKHSNIIQDTAQQVANNIVLLLLFWVLAGLLDIILRLPYFMIVYPRESIGTLVICFRHLFLIKWGDVNPVFFIIYWILMPALVLSMFGVFD
jgi:hypothetical protein